jgi:multidrug efflux system membrane fusion protein
VKVRLVLRTIPGAVLVPYASTQLSAKGPFVYVIKDDLTAELRQIQLGQRQGDLVVVDKGLHAGDKVVLSGQIGVIPGARVKVEGTPQVADKQASMCEETSS